ncbi:T9SS type A sorting domain-containing protein [Psychroserpens sp.]
MKGCILNIEANFTIDAISVYDIEGRKVLESFEDTNNQISMSDLETGIYFIKVFSGLNTETLKVIKH